MIEIELKFGIPDASLSSLRTALRARGAKRIRLQARYFDTADGLLARHAMSLRLRQEGRRWVQTLKAAGEGPVHRLEHEIPVVGFAGVTPALDLRLHDGSAAGQALHALLQTRPGVLLLERHATDITRLHCLLQDASGSLIEAALDIGVASSGDNVVPVIEFELEHKGGPLQGLFDLATACVQHGGLWLSPVTKAERGQRLLHSAEWPTAAKFVRPVLDAADTGAALLKALLQSALRQVLTGAGDVAEGVTEVETIHALRVGLRRLRTVLRELAALAPAGTQQWEAPLAHTFAQLGLTRDRQAVAASVQPLLQAAGAPLASWQSPPAPEPAATVRQAAFQVALLSLLALAHADQSCFAPLLRQQTIAFVAARLGKLHRQLLRDGARFERLPIEQQHRVRKRLKRLRYLADLTATLWHRGAVRRYEKRLSAAQHALGLHNDVSVAAAAFRDEAALRPEAWFAAGWLQGHLAVTARAARKALAQVTGANKFWT